MNSQDLPVQKFYSPEGVRILFEKTVKTENNNIDTIFQLKNKYKTLIEMWYASFFVSAIKKKFGKEYYIGSSDFPDVYLVTKDEKDREGFPVEIMQLLDYNQKKFDDNYKKLADKVFRKKGDKNYGKSSLLLVNRLSSKEFNVSEFIKLLNQKNWFFERIWLGIFRENNRDWTFFEAYPCSNFNNIGRMNYNFKDDKKIFF